MALFAAYSDANLAPENASTSNQPEWLNQSSFKIDTTPFIPTPEEKPKPVKRKKKKRKKSKPEGKNVEKQSETFRIDRKRTPEYLNVAKLHRPMVAKYRTKYYIGTSNFKKKKLKRYFHCVVEKPNESDSDEEVIKKKDLNDPAEIKKSEGKFDGFQDEEEITKMTAHYNKSLGDDPNNIEMWIKYADYQDSVFQFEKSYRKGSIAKGLRVTATRKLAILDKALSHNPDSERLLRLRLNIAVNAYPADELKQQLHRLVDKEKGNIILWQGYIEATQCSMSHCNTPSVLYLYIHCLETLHTLRRTSKLEKAQLEENILRILYQCGLFLRQAGLFEQLYTLLRDYLELNANTKMNPSAAHDENKLVELEEVVLNSRLPRHEIWLRVEKLREASHWLPHDKSWLDEADRIFFSDVRNLIHPITIPENIFKLVVTMLTLIKIPLLPCRHTIMQEFGIDYVPWALDCVETLLSVFLPIYPIDLNNKSLLDYTQKLTVGPQYLKTFPGQEEYLEFVLGVLKACMDSLSGAEKNAVTVWWFRFQRLLTILEREKQLKLTSKFREKLKSDVKNVLKSDPTNVILFREFALSEHEMGRFEKAVNALRTVLGLNCTDRTIESMDDKAAITSTFRTLIELHLRKKGENDDVCLKYFISFVLGGDINNPPRFITQTALNDVSDKFDEITDGLLESVEKLNVIEYFLPNFLTEWTICHGWFLYLRKSPNDCLKLIGRALDRLDALNGEKSLHKEILLEFSAAVLFKECTERPGCGLHPKLDAKLHEAIAAYPNNLFFLSVLAKVQSMHGCHGQPWWKFKTLLLKSGHVLPGLFLILIANNRIDSVENILIDSVSGQEILPGNSYKNSLLSLFKRLTTGDMCTKRCGLLWRLYLQFLHTYFDPTMCRNAYYAAVEECPWLKALYIDAAIYVPEDLSKIQGLITEKQLRIHIHPQELEVFLDEQI